MNNSTPYNDKQLFQLISEGNETAFESLFLAYIPELEPIVKQIVHRQEIVKDIIQEVFLCLWLDRHKLPGIEDPRKWIFRIMYNRSYKWVNRQALVQKTQQAIGTEEAGARTTEEAVGFSELSRLVKEAVQALPPQAKKIYLLSREEGLSLAEIAALLGISVQSVKNSLQRSGATMAHYLAGKGVVIPVVLLVSIWV